jgi:hypothetical protein
VPIALDELTARLTNDPPSERIAALQQLVSALRAGEQVPFDEILSLLRRRGDVGPDTESDREVREYVFHAKRAVAVMRGYHRGLRGARPSTDLGDDDLVWHAIELVWDAATIYEGRQRLETGLSFATERQRHVYAIWWTISEVRNGGFHQYFSNPTGIVAPIALAGVQALGETATANAIADACKVFDGGEITDHEYRLAVLDRHDHRVFDAQDEAFYAGYPRVFSLAAAYIREHPDEFFEPE